MEHASPEAIREALAHVYTEGDSTVENISQADLIHARLVGGPAAKARREALGELLRIGYVNGKQLKKTTADVSDQFGDILAGYQTDRPRGG